MSKDGLFLAVDGVFRGSPTPIRVEHFGGILANIPQFADVEKESGLRNLAYDFTAKSSHLPQHPPIQWLVAVLVVMLAGLVVRAVIAGTGTGTANTAAGIPPPRRRCLIPLHHLLHFPPPPLHSDTVVVCTGSGTQKN